MAATRTQGITVDTNGNFTIDKEHHGVRICLRLGPLSQRDAEQRLDAEIATSNRSSSTRLLPNRGLRTARRAILPSLNTNEALVSSLGTFACCCHIWATLR